MSYKQENDININIAKHVNVKETAQYIFTSLEH
jgi:hypothetical protein